jgi:hypothetical protein
LITAQVSQCLVRFAVLGVGDEIEGERAAQQSQRNCRDSRLPRGSARSGHRAGAPADRPVLLIDAAGVAAMTVAFTRWYEEPALTRRYGEQYEQYRRQVPGWLPRRPARPS